MPCRFIAMCCEGAGERESERKNESKKALGTRGRASWKTKTTELV